ncbi:TetR/AcrR family transcriptional regulator [Amycolatopsis acidicola]|uniref:TetR/AcrR family transcriptional regulator n=1 Tax=Amycolatopsis acidicola TaxID=2596893 RepID=A0A5N0UP34_9PSEU|nr:TetR/AcrR family transcriptional regulator [Amycolatopsis acidicola]KAA9151775.1 TetR/AcrR family transcriptional regulator [Amycolatopsis acidicola]
MARPRTHDENLRLRLLDKAGELLSTDGPKALSLRKLAGDAGTSTTAVYSLFGSKPDLVNALYAEGFRRFGERMAATGRTDDPAEDFVRLGLTYRESALADPHLYSIMFTKAVPGFEPGPEAEELARTTLAPLMDVVRDAIDGKVFADVAPETVVISAWGLVHGLVSLELNGNLPGGFDVAASYEASLRAHANGWRR